jgi:hypothetical protein
MVTVVIEFGNAVGQGTSYGVARGRVCVAGGLVAGGGVFRGVFVGVVVALDGRHRRCVGGRNATFAGAAVGSLFQRGKRLSGLTCV